MGTRRKYPLRHYLNTTHTLLYSYFISLPLLLLYELLIYLSSPDSDQMVRISVDIWIKTLFSYFGRDVLSMTLIAFALLGLFVVYRERKRLSSLRIDYFAFMVIEASAYAFLLALIISTTVSNVLHLLQTAPSGGLSVVQQMALSLGAGLYEELFFRVLLVSGLLYLFQKLIKGPKLPYILAMVVAAAIFSGVHYLGAFGDVFTFGSFLFRFLFGLALNAVYIWRGFGMAAWTHAIYDLMVIAF